MNLTSYLLTCEDINGRTVDDNVYCSIASVSDDVKHTDQGDTLLRVGYCMTHEEGVGIFIAQCPDYFQLREHNVTESGYIKLPNNISELNDYMCGPMNRRGFLCEDCIDGFGPSVTSIGYKCSNCTDAWYGVPLYLFLEFVPITVFLIILLIFQIGIASPAVSSYVLSSQLITYQLVFRRIYPIDNIIYQSGNSTLLRIVLAFYGIPTLDFFQRIVPPFCVSGSLQQIHIASLGYVSVIYSGSLIILIWIFIKLRDSNFRPLVLLWRPFHRCLASMRRKWSLRTDILDVFASLIFLSHSKLTYQVSMLFRCTTVGQLNFDGWNDKSSRVMNVDKSTSCDGGKYYLVGTLPLLAAVVFNLIPALLLVLYPFKIFRACLSKCRLNGLALTTFVEKFHGYYKDGLDGGRDMRSFSGFHYFVILVTSIYPSWSYWTVLFLAAGLLVAYLKPYKDHYVVVLDTFIFAYATFLCHLLSTDYFLTRRTQFFVCALVPAFVFGLYLLIKFCLKLKKICNDGNCWCYVRRQTETESTITVEVNSNIEASESRV